MYSPFRSPGIIEVLVNFSTLPIYTLSECLSLRLQVCSIRWGVRPRLRQTGEPSGPYGRFVNSLFIVVKNVFTRFLIFISLIVDQIKDFRRI